MKYRGVILYDGPSLVDGRPIVVIATFETANPKTGPMIQTWILVRDLDPVQASVQGLDYSICANCALRWHHGGACYVILFQAPLAVWKSYQAGNYRDFDQAIDGPVFARAKLRMGAYGDPAAVPFKVWGPLLDLVRDHTGYPHQFSEPFYDPRFSQVCMISADTQAKADQAEAAGARYFRIATDQTQELSPDEMECPNRPTGEMCVECMQCSGSGKPGPDIVNRLHGSRASRFLNNSR